MRMLRVPESATPNATETNGTPGGTRIQKDDYYYSLVRSHPPPTLALYLRSVLSVVMRRTYYVVSRTRIVPVRNSPD